MQSIREYLLGVLAAALICGIASEIMGKKGVSGSLVKLLCGVFLSVSVVAPLADLRLSALPDWTQDIQLDASQAVAEGNQLANAEYRAVITRQTQAYILDKAESLGATLTVEVTLAQDALASPEAVTLRGSISPYAKQTLSRWIISELGIEEEALKWIAVNERKKR